MISPASSPVKQTTFQVLPRFIRLRDAYFYLGMDRNRFNAEVRPYVTEVRIGTQGIAFDRLELDAWADQYKSRNGRPGLSKGDRIWDAKERQGSSGDKGAGTSTSASAGGAFVRFAAHAFPNLSTCTNFSLLNVFSPSHRYATSLPPPGAATL